MIIGVDPGGQHLGLALARRNATAPMRTELLCVKTIRLREASWTEILERVAPTLESWINMGANVVAIEQAPPTAKEDRARLVRQAAVGWSLGRVSGMVEMLCRLPVSHHLPSEWRESMLTLSARSGLVRQKPTRRSTSRRPSLCDQKVRMVQTIGGGVFRISFLGCSHTFDVEGFDKLQVFGTACPSCAAISAKSPADLVRDEWKRLACEVIAHHYPDPFRTLELDARSRARDHAKQAWQLVGVPDACEAAGVAIHRARQP